LEDADNGIVHRSRIIVGTGAALLSVAIAASAAVVADFAGGEGTGTPDSFKGTAGEGWAGAWTIARSDVPATPESTATATVATAAELSSGGGSYLQVELVGAAGAGLHRATARRSFATTSAGGGVDATKPHTITWKFRLDDADLAGFTSSNDGLLFADRTDITTGTGAQQTWAIKAQGDVNGKRFFAVNGNGSGGVAGHKDLGLPLAVNTVYTFVVTVRPGTDWAGTTYDVSLSNGADTKSVTGVKFRNKDVFTSGGNLQFTAESNATAESRKFSIDSIRAEPVAE
jgi:hypothetical protein